MSDDWQFNLGDPEPPSIPNEENLPYVGEPERWNQFTDELTYELDSLVRQWIGKMCENKKWKRSYMMRRYTMKMVIEQIYGREMDHELDARKFNKLSKILKYYSTRVQSCGSIYGKTYSKTIYTISPKRLNKPPYSLKLRLEWLDKQGIMPSYRNMALPKDNLEVGHARNPKTDENMRRRRELAKERYNERYADRKH